LRYGALGRGFVGGPEPFDKAESRSVSGIRLRPQAAPGITIIGDATVKLDVDPRGGPLRVGGNFAQPPKVHHVEPVYPAAARQAGLGGGVFLEILVGTDGRVTAAKVLRSPHEMFDQPAIDAVKQWRFEATVLQGKPVPVIMTVTVNFAAQSG
jgi:TonB family protein